jgi:hypothetical protein
MSLIAYICVHQCDECKRTVVLQDEEQYAAFDEGWYSGFGRVEFCDLCRDLATVQARIIDDEKMDHAIEAAILKCRKPEAEYVH